MGQGCSAPNRRVLQRITPAPGSIGLRPKKRNAVSVYSDITHCIQTFTVDFDMTLRQLKSLVPGHTHMEFRLDGQRLNDQASLRELGITENTLLRIVPSQAVNAPNYSDADSNSVQGPKPMAYYKPEQPGPVTSLNATLTEDPTWTLKLPIVSVPDIQLSLTQNTRRSPFGKSS